MQTSDMSVGFVRDFSEVAEWEITNFFSLNSVYGEYYESPTFLLRGCRWRLRVYPQGCTLRGCISVHLTNCDWDTVGKTVTYYIGFKRTNGTLQEFGKALKHTFTQLEPTHGLEYFLSLNYFLHYESKLAESGAFTLTCRMEGKGILPEVDSQQSKQLVELEALSSDLKDLLTSQNKCDVTIKVKDRDFRVHKAILSARSSVFRAMYADDTSEDQTRVSPITDLEPDCFSLFLNYLYTGRMEEVSFQTAYKMYSIAEKYDIQLLKSFCADYIMQNLTVENVCDVVLLSDLHGDDQFLSSAQIFFNENFLCIFLTSEWAALVKSKPSLVSKLMKQMASAALQKP